MAFPTVNLLTRTTTYCLAASVLALSSPATNATTTLSSEHIVTHYATLVHSTYDKTLTDAKAMQRAIHQFLASPTQSNLDIAKAAWINARESYSLTEAFRFYEGPIDFADDQGNEGPEGRLNAWPVNEAYIDYVQGDADAGLVNNRSISLSKATLTEQNQRNDEADVSTGYHAIEFLLWGQDLSLDSAGNRPVSDYTDNTANARRRDYLSHVTQLLIDDLTFLEKSWSPSKDNYRTDFVQSPESLGKIFTSLATLSGFELASERLATALDSGDQEDEQSCFSDNTHRDFIQNTQAIYNVYFGEFNTLNGPGLHDLLAHKDAELANTLATTLNDTLDLVKSLPHPIDREILATKEDSPARAQAEKAVTSLQALSEQLIAAANVLGVKAHIAE